MSAWWLMLIVPISMFFGFFFGAYATWQFVKSIDKFSKKISEFFDGLAARAGFDEPIDVDCEVL